MAQVRVCVGGFARASKTCVAGAGGPVFWFWTPHFGSGHGVSPPLWTRRSRWFIRFVDGVSVEAGSFDGVPGAEESVEAGLVADQPDGDRAGPADDHGRDQDDAVQEAAESIRM